MKPSKNSNDSSQEARFREAAEAAEADTSPDALDRIFGRLDLSKKPDPEDGDKATTDDS